MIMNCCVSCPQAPLFSPCPQLERQIDNNLRISLGDPVAQLAGKTFPSLVLRIGFQESDYLVKKARTHPTPHAVRADYMVKQTTFGSVISWSANLIPSRPSPESLTPPNGMSSRR